MVKCPRNNNREQQGSYRSGTFATVGDSAIQGFAMPANHHHQQSLNHHYQLYHNRYQLEQQQQSRNAIDQDSSHSNQQHIESISNPNDLTEPIRIRAEDMHISQESFDNELGGNISDVLDCLEEENILNYGSNLVEQHQPNYLNGSYNSTHHVQNSAQSSDRIIAHVRQHLRADVSSSSSSTYPSRTDINTVESSSTSSSATQTRIPVAIVESPEDCDNKQDPTLTRAVRLNGSKSITEDLKSFDLAKFNDLSVSDDQTTSLNIIKHSEDTKNDCPEEGESICLKLRVQKPQITTTKPDVGKQELEQHRKKPQIDPDQRLKSYNALPTYTNNHQVGVIKNYLFNGSSFSGYQRSRDERYEVNVKIQHVDYENNYICGYLCIRHLTRTHPSLTTFFDGEIISEQYPFFTRKWDATAMIDRAHWTKFDDFRKKYTSTFNDPEFDYEALRNSDYIYMRWKEHFLVPDHTIKHVEGASYAGFYYTCYSKRTREIEGYYFHISENFESFQSLNLQLDCQDNSSQVYEFR